MYGRPSLTKFASPQDEREALWEKQNQLSSAAIPSSGRDDLLFERENDNSQAYEGELSRLRKEVNVLKDALARTNRELKAYQVKYPSQFSIPGPEDSLLPKWTAAPDVLEPIFTAYDAMVRELRSIVSRQGTELESFKLNFHNIMSENELLRQEKMEYLRNRPNSGEHAFDPLKDEFIAELQTKLALLTKENNGLYQQKAMLTESIEEAHADLEKRVAESMELRALVDALEEKLRRVAAQLLQTETERDEAAKQAVSFSDSLGKASSEIDSLKDALKLANHKCKEADLSLSEAQAKLKHLTGKYEEEMLEAMRRVKRSEDRVRELHNGLASKSSELDALSEAHRKLKREYASCRSDAEGMVQVMSALQRQVAEYAEREEDVNKLSRESKNLIEEALSAKDQALVREEQCKRDLNRLLEERTRLAVKRQADIDAAVDNARQRAAEQFQALDKDLKEMAEKNAHLKLEYDRALRDSKTKQEQLERMQQLQLNERSAFEGSIRELSDKLNAAVVNKEEEIGRRNEVQEVNKDYRHTIDKLRQSSDALRASLSSLEAAKENEVTSLKNALREASKENAEKTRVISRLQRDLEESKENLVQTVSAVERKYIEENSLLRRRSQEFDRTAKELEISLTSGASRHQMQLEQVQEQSAHVLQQAQAHISQEASTIKSLTLKNKELDSQIREMASDRISLTKFVDDARYTIDKLKMELQQTKGTVGALTEQLASSYSARSEGAAKSAMIIQQSLSSYSAGSPNPYQMPAWHSPTTSSSAAATTAALLASASSPQQLRSLSSGRLLDRELLLDHPNSNTTNSSSSTSGGAYADNDAGQYSD